MAHYAIIDSTNTVVEVITGRDENETVDGISDWETYYASLRPGHYCKRTSYNTYIDLNGVSQHANGGTPFRKTFASIGSTYDPNTDTFNPPAAE